MKPAESSEESDSEDEPMKPAPVVKVANGKGKVNAAPVKKAESSSEEDSDSEEEAPPAKVNGKAATNGTAAKKPANGVAVKVQANGNAKKPVAKDDESEDESDSGKYSNEIFS